MKRKTITVLGDGGWGTTLSILLNRKGFDVCLWSAFGDYTALLRQKRENVKFLKGIKIPKDIKITSEIKQALAYSKTIILAIPSQYLRSVIKKINFTPSFSLDFTRDPSPAHFARDGEQKSNQRDPELVEGRVGNFRKFPIRKYGVKDYVFLSATKGIENKTLMRMSEVIIDELGEVNLAVLSGPNIAQEVAKGLPAVSVVASKNKKTAEYFQALLMNERFRIYTNNDVVGVELGGSLKNIIALACGISDGLGLGTNAKAALLTRGLVEISRLGVAMGAKRETFFGVSGVGDLVTTCTSLYSRNRFVGEQIAKGLSLTNIVRKMQMVAEGILTTKAVYELSKRYAVEMPITKEIYYVLYKHKPPQRAVSDLMLREKKPEQ